MRYNCVARGSDVLGFKTRFHTKLHFLQRGRVCFVCLFVCSVSKMTWDSGSVCDHQDFV